MVQLICSLFALAVAGILGGLGYFMKRRDYNLTRVTKALALLLFAVMFIRYSIEHVAVYFVRGVNMYSPFGDDAVKTVLAIFLIWFSYAAMLAVVMNEFFDCKTLRRVVYYFAVPTFFLLLIFFPIYGVGVLGDEGYSLHEAKIYMMVLECALGIGIPLMRLLASEGPTLPKGKAKIVSFFSALAFSIMTVMPAHVPQSLLGYADLGVKAEDFSWLHRTVLYFAIIVPFVIFHLLKNKAEATKRFVMIYMTVGLMWIYLGRWNLEMWMDPPKWPLHLCNTAMILIPLCLIFRLKKVFNFCLFVNVMGALLAMFIPNSFPNVLATESVSYWINHYPAFSMPILLVALGVFPRPKFREWCYSLSAFVVYFISILIINATFTAKYGSSDFFFLNSDFVVSKLGRWAELTREFVVTVPIGEMNLIFYPIYQAIFFGVYVAITVAIWFLYALLFKTWDSAEDIRLRERDYKRMKKELKEYLGNRPASEPIGGDSSPRLALKSFSKRYGSNKHYSVKDASFEVVGGEIFGFLGPNGAGKSTIIKSVVGIQTITSGAIEVCGYDVDKQPVQAKMNLGFVPDHYALYENLTGREYINYIADLYEVEREWRDATVEKYVERFQLTGSFDNQMKTYSHGMKQKIAIMAALVHNPKVWILDEPLTGLDPNSIHEVKECMKEHAENGNIVFFSSHIIDVVEKICDRIAIIKKGKIRAVRKMSDLEAEGIDLEEFYLSIINAPEDEEAFAEPVPGEVRG